MQALISPYVSAQYNGQTYNVINFKCRHCGQHFGDSSLKMAVFLYGIFFLTGKNAQYSGITCPKCQNSILFNISGSLDNFINSFDLFETPNGKTLVCDLRYYSSASSLAYQNCFLDGFDAYSFPIKIGTIQRIIFMENYLYTLQKINFSMKNTFVLTSGTASPPIGAFSIHILVQRK